MQIKYADGIGRGASARWLRKAWSRMRDRPWSLDLIGQSIQTDADLFSRRENSKIARQFTAGLEFAVAQVPKGRLNDPMSYVSSCFHCVFGTKERRPFLTAELRERLWPYLGGIARDHRMKAIRIGGTNDHVHILLSLPATMPISKAMQLIKGGSSKWVHENFPGQRRFAWQSKYGGTGRSA